MAFAFCVLFAIFSSGFVGIKMAEICGHAPAGNIAYSVYTVDCGVFTVCCVYIFK